MQYKNYEIQTVNDGCIIRNSKGKYLIKTATDNEAREWIDDLDEDTKQEIEKEDPYTKFTKYCKNLAGKSFNDGKLRTIYEKPLKGYIESFEQLGYKVNYRAEEAERNEYVYIVDSVEKII